MKQSQKIYTDCFAFRLRRNGLAMTILRPPQLLEKGLYPS